jgi:hypothetical protein
MTDGFNMVFNSLVFTLKPQEKIPTLATGKYFELKIAFGTTKAVVPLGYVYNDLDVAPGFTNVVSDYSNGVLTFKYVSMSMGRSYKVSVKVAWPDANALSTGPDLGFGMVALNYEANTIIRSQSVFKTGFDSILLNKPFITNERVIAIDTAVAGQKVRHRGYSAFRSDLGSSMESSNPPMTTDVNLNKYDFDLSRNGIRKADSQFFWFQSSLGPNSLYYGTALGNDHNGNKTYIDVYLPPSISSKTTYFDDQDNTFHCAIYSRKQKGMALGNNWGWNNQLEHLQAQKVFDYPVTSR